MSNRQLFSHVLHTRMDLAEIGDILCTLDIDLGADALQLHKDIARSMNLHSLESFLQTFCPSLPGRIRKPMTKHELSNHVYVRSYGKPEIKLPYVL
jgi:hypothetical protein